MHPATALQPKRALIVEDDPMQAEITRRMLERPTGEAPGGTNTSCCVHGQWVVTWAETLATAANLLLHNKYDVVLLDMLLPDGEREDAVKAVRDVAPAVCIVVQSSLDDRGLVRKLILGGYVADYIVKGDISTSLALKQRLCHVIDASNVMNDVGLEKRGQHGLA